MLLIDPHVLFSYSALALLSILSGCSLPDICAVSLILSHLAFEIPQPWPPPHWNFPTSFCSASSTCLSVFSQAIGSSNLRATPEPSKLCLFHRDACHLHIWYSRLKRIQSCLYGNWRTKPSLQPTPSLLHHGNSLNLKLVLKLQYLETAHMWVDTLRRMFRIRFNELEYVCARNVDEVEDQRLESQQKSDQDRRFEVTWLWSPCPLDQYNDC